MADLPFAGNPFLYHPRWSSIDASQGLTDEMKYILEERDRELEDYLGSLGGSSGTMMASSLSRTTNQSTAGTPAAINFNVTDYLSGCTAVTGQLQIDVAGKWHCTTFAEAYTFSVSDYGYYYLQQKRAGATVREVFDFIPNGGPINTGPFTSLSADFDCQVNDLIRCEIREVGVGAFSIGITASTTKPALLQAHLVG